MASLTATLSMRDIRMHILAHQDIHVEANEPAAFIVFCSGYENPDKIGRFYTHFPG